MSVEGLFNSTLPEGGTSFNSFFFTYDGFAALIFLKCGGAGLRVDLEPISALLRIRLGKREAFILRRSRARLLFFFFWLPKRAHVKRIEYCSIRCPGGQTQCVPQSSAYSQTPQKPTLADLYLMLSTKLCLPSSRKLSSSTTTTRASVLISPVDFSRVDALLFCGLIRAGCGTHFLFLSSFGL